MAGNQPLFPGDPGYEEYAAENKGPLILGVTSSLTILTFLFVAGRIYSRFLSAGKLAIDDYIVIVCICLSISYVALAACAISYGAGRHVTTLDPAHVTKAVYYTVVSFVPGVTSFMLPKFAVVILLARLLAPGKIHRTIMWVICVIYLLLTAGMLVINFAQCTPAAKQWGAAEGTCWDRKITVDYAMMLGAVSVVFDFYLAVWPTIVLWGLQMNWKKKVGLSTALGFGYCAGAVTIYKTNTLHGLLDLQDFTYAVDDVVLWTNIEANFVLIGACIPTLYPLIRRVWGASALGGSTNKYSNNKNKNSSSGPSGHGSNNAIVTIGSMPKRSRHDRRAGRSVSGLDTFQDSDDSKYIILEERSFQTSEVHDPELANRTQEKIRQTKVQGW
ncbi:hypothetical protein QBC37DRAFT_460079 [Rhypophila decipiens]|uniref:Rhodopsin domain-containing protein n=1 Tax=Rhypophila decipiens TaxID=261697 RepID=A0AAN6YAI8_9PEZI|nr:hypothetical protein QBC37DRAFT_460079 [Rhypophila decipiens]